MINRTLIRTKVIQTLFAHYKNEGNTLLTAKKELLHSFDDVYCLYMLMLEMFNEMVNQAEERNESEKERARITHQSYKQNLNFINNRLASQLFNNRQLRSFIEQNHLGWDAAHESLRLLWKEISESEAYTEYMSIEFPTYEDDKQVWRKIITNVLADNPTLEDALDELEVALDHKGWTTDMNIVLSYVVKTIKRFKSDSNPDHRLLEMFDSEDELTFGKTLLQNAITNEAEYRTMIEAHLKNWDINRIAYIDLIIMQTAIAELTSFPEIPIQVTLNEYIEIAKEYSTNKSHGFINGVLDEIIKELKQQNKLIKAITID
ncbi:MAG: transcription antitermination factor NusB [Paludibacteraceae bacterium]|nr:transcription antitermination factor NusB [Paludibacteraceae bacterium]